MLPAWGRGGCRGMEIWRSGAREACCGSGDVEVVEVWRVSELRRLAAGVQARLGGWLTYDVR